MNPTPSDLPPDDSPSSGSPQDLSPQSDSAQKSDEAIRARRVEELVSLLTRYQTAYYGGTSEVEDAEFDALWDELARLDPANPLLARIGSELDPAVVSGARQAGHPEGGVGTGGAMAIDGFPKARHLIPMGSQDKAAKPEDFLAWAEKMKPAAFVVQHKLDGASLELQYENGILKKAITRGDGIIGDDISANARRMKGCLEKLDLPFTGGVRGEVIMPRAVWTERFSDKANCRNAANGIMRRKDGEGAELLELICYDAATEDDAYFTDEPAKIDWLRARGFAVTPSVVFADPMEVIRFRERIAAERASLPYDIDGLVIKDRATDMADLRRTRPERQIAFKFDLEEAISVLRAVEWSESGATYTPIGIVDPVRLAGTTVQRANLNNPDMIRLLGLRLGSRVVVVKRGEIIPKIERLAPAEPQPGISTGIPVGVETVESEIVFPVSCAVCSATLVDGGTRLYCPNPACPKRVHHRIEKWVSVLDIREFGDLLLRRLFDAGRLNRIFDLYTLKADELAALDRMGELSASKVLRSIYAPRTLSLAAFVAGFDFEGVGETIMAKVAASGFDTLDKLRSARIGELSAIHGLGSITAGTIVEGLAETRDDMDAVLATGIISIEAPLTEAQAPLRFFSFCFTGELAGIKRSEAEEQIKKLGGVAKTSVTKDLSFLVTNDPASGSSKNEKARKLGVRILDESEFLALLANPGGAVRIAELVNTPDSRPETGSSPESEAPYQSAKTSGGSGSAQGDLFSGDPH